MNNENGKSKKVDLGMTVPHQRPGKEKDADNFSDDFAPPKSAKQSRMDDLEMIPPPNINKPNSQPVSLNFDKTTANINILKDVRQDEMPPASNQPPTDDWGRTIHNISIFREGKPADWEVTIPPVNNPKQEKKDDWSMPEPIFRVSEGESLEVVAKRTAVFNLKDIEDFGKTTSNFNFSEVSPPEPFNQTAPNLNIQSQPDVSEPFPANKIVVENKPPARSSNYKVFFIVVGLFSMLLFASVILIGIYLLFLNYPWKQNH